MNLEDTVLANMYTLEPAALDDHIKSLHAQKQSMTVILTCDAYAQHTAATWYTLFTCYAPCQHEMYIHR